jgi:chromosome segregation ATPase
LSRKKDRAKKGGPRFSFLFKTRKNAYYITMDNRKKQIDDLEKQKRENRASLDVLLAHLGEGLLGRIGEGAEPAFEDIGEYRRLQREIADSGAAIQKVEEQIRQFRELEEKIEQREREDSARSKELAGLYGRLGRLLLDDDACRDAVAPYREQADALLTKVRSLEDRLAELEQKEGGNVFTWIGKNAQGLVLRSFLTKAQDNLEQLRRSVGEYYSRREVPPALSPGEDSSANSIAPAEASGGMSVSPAAVEIAQICAEIEQARSQARALSGELAALREERRGISVSFNAEGGPLKQIQVLKKRIDRIQDELQTLYRRFGADAAAVDVAAGMAAGMADGMAAGRGQERRQFIDSLLKPEDQAALEQAAQINRSILDADTAIGKLRASLAIDEEAARIEKYRRAIEDKRLKIIAAEEDIADFEKSIADSEKHIAELRKLL